MAFQADHPTVDQISLPMRIALAASLVFAALWFVALRPKPVSDVDSPLPTVSADAVDEGSSGAEADAAKAKVKADAAKADTPKAATPAKKKVVVKVPVSGPQAAVADIKAGRTVVLLFSSLNVKTDDREVRQAVAAIERHDGEVRVYRTRMSSLPKYEAITKSIPVTTSPTVFVINKAKQAQVITGLTTTREIDQAVRTALKSAK
jgi:hypothetical protein